MKFRNLSASLLCCLATGTVFAEDYKPKHQPPEPPPIAYQACADLNEGDKVEFSNKDGKNFEGVCRELNGRLAAMPNHPLGGPGGRRGPPPGDHPQEQK